MAGQRHHRFGSSSESIEQLQLALETSEIAVAKMTAKLRLPDEEPKDKPKRRPIPDHIPRMEVELTTGDDDCPQCGGGLRRLGEDGEPLSAIGPRTMGERGAGIRSWPVHREPYRATAFRLFRLRSLSLKPRYHRAPSNAVVPVLACWRMYWSTNTPPLVHCYAIPCRAMDHLPLYRQSRIFERDGIGIDRSTLADWVGKSTALLEPLADAIHCPGSACLHA